MFFFVFCFFFGFLCLAWFCLFCSPFLVWEFFSVFCFGHPLFFLENFSCVSLIYDIGNSNQVCFPSFTKNKTKNQINTSDTYFKLDHDIFSFLLKRPQGYLVYSPF